MLTYVYFGTNDLERATRFYDAVLAPLGMQRCITGDPEWDRISAGWGIYEEDGARELAFWIGKPFNQQPATSGNGSMVAFKARCRIRTRPRRQQTRRYLSRLHQTAVMPAPATRPLR